MAIRAPRDSEWATRKTLIDKRLRGAGWRITPFDATKTLPTESELARSEGRTFENAVQLLDRIKNPRATPVKQRRTAQQTPTTKRSRTKAPR